jgi:hypothetical protein
LVIFYDRDNKPLDFVLIYSPEIVPDGLVKRLSGHVDASVKKLTTQNAPGGNKYVLSNTPSTRGRQVFLERSMGA